MFFMTVEIVNAAGALHMILTSTMRTSYLLLTCCGERLRTLPPRQTYFDPEWEDTTSSLVHRDSELQAPSNLVRMAQPTPPASYWNLMRSSSSPKTSAQSLSPLILQCKCSPRNAALKSDFFKQLRQIHPSQALQPIPWSQHRYPKRCLSWLGWSTLLPCMLRSLSFCRFCL